MSDHFALIDCTLEHAPEILAIFNEEIVHSTSLYDYQPRPPASMDAWFEAKRKGGYPVVGALTNDGALAGFASYGAFRPWPAYKYSVEHSVYVHRSHRQRGLGKLLVREILQRAAAQNYHAVIGGIDSSNQPSIQLHRALGFTHCASMKQVGFKFGRWLDLEFYQYLLPTPEHPIDG